MDNKPSGVKSGGKYHLHCEKCCESTPHDLYETGLRGGKFYCQKCLKREAIDNKYEFHPSNKIPKLRGIYLLPMIRIVVVDKRDLPAIPNFDSWAEFLNKLFALDSIFWAEMKQTGDTLKINHDDSEKKAYQPIFVGQALCEGEPSRIFQFIECHPLVLDVSLPRLKREIKL